MGRYDQLLFRPAVNAVGEMRTRFKRLDFAESAAQFHAAEMLDIGLTARLIKVTIKGCRASDTRIFHNAV